MAIPDYQSIMLPLLRFLADKKEHSLRQVIEHICKEFDLSEEERTVSTHAHKWQPVIDNRVGWAKTCLKKAGLLEYTKRGYSRITDRGVDVLGQRLLEINVKFLSQFPEFVEFRSLKRKSDKSHI